MAFSYRALTLNCKGLNNPLKVRRLSNWLTKERPNVLFLQETHQKRSMVTLLKTKWFEYQYYAGGSSKVRGVAIAISKGMQVQNSSVLCDPRGSLSNVLSMMYPTLLHQFKKKKEKKKANLLGLLCTIKKHKAAEKYC